MTLATSDYGQPINRFEFGPGVVSYDWSASEVWAEPSPAFETAVVDTPPAPGGLRAMYVRMAREYEMEAPVPDRRGGVTGDLFPF